MGTTCWPKSASWRVSPTAQSRHRRAGPRHRVSGRVRASNTREWNLGRKDTSSRMALSILRAAGGPSRCGLSSVRRSGCVPCFQNPRLFHPRGYGRWQRDSVREVGVVTGCFFLMRLEDWRSFGGFDPEFFMYGEETDLCMRAIKEGMRPVVTPTATIVHHGGASEKVRVDKMVRLFDAQVRLFRRHFSRFGFRMVFVSMTLGVLIRAILMGGVSRFPGRPRENDWAEIWQRRGEWSSGAKGVRLSRTS